MSLEDLNHYLIEREKYINLFMILNHHHMISDIKIVILRFAPFRHKGVLCHDFDQNIKSILTYLKHDRKLRYTLTPDAYHFFNHLIIGLIRKLKLLSITVMEHCRRRRLMKEDVAYAMGIANQSKLKKIMQSADHNVKQFNESKLDHKRQSRSSAANTLIDPPKVEKWMLVSHPPKIAKLGKDDSDKKIQVEKQTIIYITGVLDALIEQMILNNKVGTINVDDLLKSSEKQFNHLLLELYNKNVMCYLTQ